MFADQQAVSLPSAPAAPNMRAPEPPQVAAPYPPLASSYPPQAQQPSSPQSYAAPEPASGPRLRSEAERDLLRALRAAR